MRIKIFICCALLYTFFALGIVGKMDERSEVQELATYCKNVENGVWPDYKKIFESECKK